MAHLKLRPLLSSALLAAALLAPGLAAADEGQVELELYDRAVLCNGATNQCTAPDGAPAESLRAVLFMSTTASTQKPSGLYLFFQAVRASGAVLLVELDLPTVGAGAPVVSVKEYQGNKEVFSAQRVAARIELPSKLLGKPDGCACLDGRLELLATSAGPDGVPGTADDEVRRLSRGRFNAAASGFCAGARVLDVSAGFEIAPLTCPAPTVPGPAPTPGPGTGTGTGTGSHGGGSGGGGGGGVSVNGGVGVEVDPGGCGGDESDVSYEDSGCDADSSDVGDSGCEGDTGGGCDGAEGCDAGSTGGCEGADFGSGGCSGGGGDCRIARGTSRRGHRSNLTLPVILIGLYLLQRRGRHRR